MDLSTKSPVVAYFDWNIIAYYRDLLFKNETMYSVQFEKIQKLLSNDEILSYYSDAHINDLIPVNDPGSFDCSNDLAAISKITKNVYLNYNILDVEFKFLIEDPKNIYEHLLENYNPIFDLETVFEPDDPIGRMLYSFLNMIPSPIPENSPYKPDNNNTLMDVMKYFANRNNETILDPKVYRQRKNEMFNADTTNTFQDIYIDLQKGNIEKFETMLKPLFKHAGNLIKFRLDETMLIFLLLDQVRYASDKAQKSIQTDSQHAAFASIPNSQYFVSNDKNLLKKTAVAYHILNIPTIPITLDDFVNRFSMDNN